jgi:LemA protein
MISGSVFPQGVSGDWWMYQWRWGMVNLVGLLGQVGLFGQVAGGNGATLWVVLGVIAAAVVGGILLYNQLIAMEVRCDNAWSDIDVQLKRRHDLIPNIVEAVKGYVGYEKGTLEAVVSARAKAMSAGSAKDTAAAENALTGTLKSLFALAESYPQLRGSEQFTGLQQSLSSIEEALQAARRYYNASVRDLNTSVRMFPWNLLAGVAGARPREFFEISDAAERAVPSVKMS